MVTIREMITVSRDDPRFDSYEQMLSDWERDDMTESVVWTRVQMIGYEEKQNDK